ncbi:unnamed protein product [Strongylus vulgaris]|uniref:Uncharacterized protein n=1 Tax=Strongylus vulgaris TaxID=40348 RepID=A0A3P7IBW0_STRVU|nr:unnamed protein product [Strongylus vulgaris]
MKRYSLIVLLGEKAQQELACYAATDDRRTLRTLEWIHREKRPRERPPTRWANVFVADGLAEISAGNE